MAEGENSYRSVLKGTSIFGGVQLFLILVNLIRGKFVAMFLGPDGMGISSLFTTASNTIVKASSLGLNLAIVRETAERRDDPGAMSELMAVVGRLIQFTALAGCLVCVLLSGLLSRITFGSPDYAWQFVLLAAAIYFSVAGAGRLSVLQGLHEVKRVSRASVVGALTGLFGGVPLYWFYGTKGIVPAIVLLSFTTWLFYTVSLRKVLRCDKPRFSISDHKPLVRKLVMLGLVLCAGEMIGALVGYLVNFYLRCFGDIDTVGLYNAANSLTNQYVGTVFAAMSLDFFPRLAARASDNGEVRRLVNRQTEIVAIIIAPIACLVIATAPIIIKILLTDSFAAITPVMRWMGLGVVFKALQYPMGYIAFAKNNRRLFFWMEAVAGNLLYLGGIVVCYRLWGFIGLGISLVVENIISAIMYAVVNYKEYGYTVDRRVVTQAAMCLAFAVGCFICSAISSAGVSYALMTVVSAASITYSFVAIKRLLRVKE